MDKLLGLLKKWSLSQDHFYTKSSSIIEQIEHDGRVFYSKYQKHDDPLSEEILRHYLSQKTPIAVPVTKENMGQYIFFLYDGDAPERFRHLFEHLMSMQGISTYQIDKGDTPQKIIASIYLPMQTVSNLHLYAKDISKILEKNISKSWKIIPDPNLPEQYNIVPIPHIN